MDNVALPLSNIDQIRLHENHQNSLNEKIACVFSEKASHLENHEFIKIDREMLQMIGIKNKMSYKKDKHGNLKIDKSGNPKIQDTCHDFNNAIKCL